MRLRRGVIGIPGLLAILAGCDSPAVGVANLALDPVASIGSVDAAGAALTSVAALMLTDSTILVLESSPPRLAVFDQGGHWLRDIGRAGDGPGEFRYPTHVGVTAGRIWVGDPFGSRIEFFEPDGTPIESYRWSLPADSLGERAMPTAIFEDGSVLAAPRRMINGSITTRSYYSATTSGEAISRLYRETVSPGDIFSGMGSGGGFFEGRHPLEESPLVTVAPDGSALIVVERIQAEDNSSGVFRVLIVASDNTVLSDFSVPYIPISAAGWLDQYLERLEQRMMRERGEVTRDLLDVMREDVAGRRHYPPVTAVVAGTDGSIWVRREELVAADSVRWQILNAEGGAEGSLIVPAGLQILRASRTEVWAVELDDLDVPFLIRYRVVERE